MLHMLAACHCQRLVREDEAVQDDNAIPAAESDALQAGQALGGGAREGHQRHLLAPQHPVRELGSNGRKRWKGGDSYCVARR